MAYNDEQFYGFRPRTIKRQCYICFKKFISKGATTCCSEECKDEYDRLPSSAKESRDKPKSKVKD